MEHADVARWLQTYITAWRSYDRAAIGELFAEDARYRYHPYDEWTTGRGAIVESWFEEPDEPESWDAAYEPAALDGEVAFAIGSTTYTSPDGSIRKIYDNCFQMRFDADGRCAEFTEWFMERPAS